MDEFKCLYMDRQVTSQTINEARLDVAVLQIGQFYDRGGWQLQPKIWRLWRRCGPGRDEEADVVQVLPVVPGHCGHTSAEAKFGRSWRDQAWLGLPGDKRQGGLHRSAN